MATKMVATWRVEQRVLCDGVSTSFLPIDSGVPRGTTLGPILFLIMVNDIKSVDTSRILLVKYADDITLSTYRSKNIRTALT